MNSPSDEEWERVERLAEELKQFSPEEAASHLARLAAAGENPSLLTLACRWMELPAPMVPLSKGSVVGGRYTLKEKIGDGGMGSVWRAEQKLADRDVALKVIHPALITPDLNARFLREIALLGRLNHPGIVKLFDAGIHESASFPPIPFFTMELVEGSRLDEWCAGRRENRATLLRVMALICDAVQNAHEQQIVHRDLKPANILVRQNGQPVVFDFGIARLAGAVAGEEQGMFSGTPQYAAPEQFIGSDEDFRSGESVDVYSTGVILFQILTGRKLFEFAKGASFKEIRDTVVEGPVARLADVLPECPPILDEIVGRALRRNPADRFYSMAAFGRALRRAALSLTEVPKPVPVWRPAANVLVPGTGWRLTEKIGKGSVGEVWLGQHNQLGEFRVFKFCDTEENVRTLKRELTLFRLLKERIGRNPHFVQLHEVSLDEPPWYLMMDYSAARDLAHWCADQPGQLAAVPIELRIEIVAQVAEALQAAHEAGILHRDIKPSNLLVGTDPSTHGMHVLIADFGIGQIIAEEWLKDVRGGFTRTVKDLQRSSLSGTMLYMAPEVLEGHTATARSDIYSLGVVLWQLLTGNLNAALDPADWATRIEDPLLRADLARCLAGLPEKRWASAGEFAASLRALPERHAAADRQSFELTLRERSAYRRGVMRTAAVAFAIVALVTGLAWTAWLQRRQAEAARGQIALEQAASLPQLNATEGQRKHGLQLLETAVRTVTNRVALRSAAAMVLGMPHLVPVTNLPRFQITASPPIEVPISERETARTISPDGQLLARARDLDGVNGAVNLFDASGRLRATVQRKPFPWVPIAEPALLRFSSDNSRLAVGGAATSRHILLCNTTNGAVQSYLFHGSDPLSCAWHPDGRLLAVGCADGTVRVWDTAAAISATGRASGSNQFDLPPTLDVPANDVPWRVLHGHRSPVLFTAFAGQERTALVQSTASASGHDTLSPLAASGSAPEQSQSSSPTHGRWLASIDAAGYLRIHHGFPSGRLPESLTTDSAQNIVGGTAGTEPALALESRLERAEEITGLETFEDRLTIHRGTNAAEEFHFKQGELPASMHVGFGVTQLAWKGDATEVCAITLTDIHWLQTSPLGFLHTASGKNPVGVAYLGENYWALPKDAEFIEQQVIASGQGWQLIPGAAFKITEAVQRQGALTKLAAARDGRVAVYRGRRIQFFRRHEAASKDSAITAQVGGGEDRDIFWDNQGTLLGTTVRGSNGLHLETWATTTNFPPECQMLASVDVQGERILPAQRGELLIGRSIRRGVFTLDAGTRVETVLDSSSVARQNAPMAVSANGEFLALVADRNVIHLRQLPAGRNFAELHSRNPGALIFLCWHSSGRFLAGLTEDGHVLVWKLGAWRDWLKRHRLEE